MRKNRVRAIGLATTGALLAGAYTLWACWLPGSLTPQPAVPAVAAGRFRIRVRKEIPGVDCPQFRAISKATFSEQAEVVGVCVNGLARAYPLSLLKIVDYHIVNDVIDGRPVSVTYCDLADRVRVLTWKHRGYPIPLGVGGLDENRQLLLLFGDRERFRQESRELPLEDHPFVRVTLSEWSARHPRSLVFVGAAQ